MRNSNSPAFAAFGSLASGLWASSANAKEAKIAIDISARRLKIEIDLSVEEGESVLLPSFVKLVRLRG